MPRPPNSGSSSFRDDPLKDPQEYDPEDGRAQATAKDRREHRRAMAGNEPSTEVEPGMGSTAGRPRKGTTGR